MDAIMLQQAAERGVRLVALWLIEDARQAAHKLNSHASELGAGDADANKTLHDFRVSLRRLRSWIRAFKPWLRDHVSVKRRHALAETLDATGAARDADAHLKWLRKEGAALNARQVVGRAWLAQRVERERREGWRDALSAAADFESFASILTDRLESARPRARERKDSERFGVVVAERIQSAGEALQLRLTAVDRYPSVCAAHRARLAAKHLICVTAPVSKLVARGDPILTALKRLRDHLGELHDVHVFAEELGAATQTAVEYRAHQVSEVKLKVDEIDIKDDSVRRVLVGDPRPGLVALASRLHECGRRAFATIERDWLNNAGSEFFERLGDLVDDLKNLASKSTDIERELISGTVQARALTL